MPRKCARHDGWTPARQAAFIDALNDTGSVKAACAAVGMAEVGAYQLRRKPGAEEFAAAWAAAQENGIGILRDALMHRAIHGVEVPVYSYGKLVGARRVYNDRVGTFMLANYDGQLSGGASGLPLRLKRVVDEEVKKARAGEKARSAEFLNEAMDHYCKLVDAMRARFTDLGLIAFDRNDNRKQAWARIVAWAGCEDSFALRSAVAHMRD
ncbi:MAG: hypothetical protein J7485_05820 [Sphingobium sp.]|nr:hypothetical protein [Sphingobium sp.]